MIPVKFKVAVKHSPRGGFYMESVLVVKRSVQKVEHWMRNREYSRDIQALSSEGGRIRRLYLNSDHVVVDTEQEHCRG